jgi:hypothetical protein
MPSTEKMCSTRITVLGHGQETEAPILEVLDRWGRTIRLVRRVWLDHIVIAHREIGGHLDAVHATLTGPDIVTHDMNRPDAECFYRLGGIPEVAHRHLKVVVRFVPEGDGVGYVSTAYISRNVRKREPIKWQK